MQNLIAPRFGAALRAAATALLLAAPGPAQALSYTPQTPVTVARDAASVVIATVVRAEPRTTPEGAEIELLTLEVHERWRGAGGAAMQVRQVRTLYDQERGARVYVPGNIALAEGQTYLLFLPPEQALPTLPVTVAGEAGAYRAERVGQTWRFSTLGGRPVLDVRPEGWVVDLPATNMVYPAGQVPPPAAARARSPGDLAGLATRWRSLVRGVK